MSLKRFITMVAVVLVLGVAGLFCLYMTLGRMGQVLRQQGRIGGAPTGSSADGAEKIQQMTLTPAGESQLHEAELKAREAGKSAEDAAPRPAAPPQPASAPPPSSRKAPAAPTVAPASPGVTGASGASGN